MLRDPYNIPTSDLIEAKAKEQGMLTMYQAGLLRALAGETTIEEVNRVI